MATRIVLDTPRFKGDFPFDFDADPPTTLEWKWVKKISGYQPLTFWDALVNVDAEAFTALAVILLYRDGRIRKEDAVQTAAYFDDLPFTKWLTFIGDEEGAADDPPAGPAETPETGPPLRSIGGSSSSMSDPSGNGLSPTGRPDSQRSATFDHVTSKT